MNKKVAIVKCDSYKPHEIYQALKKALDLIGVGGIEQLRDKDFIIKPNLCLPAVPDAHLTTHPEVIRQLIKILMEKNNRVRIGDTSIGYDDTKRSDRVWEETGMNGILGEFHIKKVHFQQNIVFNEIEIDGKKFILPVADEILNSDVINVPKLKTHSYMLMSGCVKNLYGVLAGDSKKRLHHLAGTKENFAKLLLAINELVNNKLNVVDAVVGIEGEGPGAKGKIRPIGLIVAGFDAVLVDKVLEQIINLNGKDVLTNYYANTDEPIVVGEKIEDVKLKDFKLPVINPKSDRIIEHVIEAKLHHAYITEEKCKKCGLCYRNCPSDAVCKSFDKYTVLDDKCISCFVCMEVCPYGAISIENRKLFNFIKGNEK